MTNEEIIAKFRAEIERRIEAHHSHEHFCAEHEFRDVLSFLSDLEKSKVSDGEGLEEEIKRYYYDWDGDCLYAQTARHFAQWGAEHLKK